MGRGRIARWDVDNFSTNLRKIVADLQEILPELEKNTDAPAYIERYLYNARFSINRAINYLTRCEKKLPRITPHSVS